MYKYNTKKSSSDAAGKLFASVLLAPFIFMIGLILSLWQGMWAAKILELGTSHFGWRPFSTCEVLIASLAFGVVRGSSSNKDEKPLSIFIGWLLGPILAYLLALAVVCVLT